MPYVVIEDFRAGLDRRKNAAASPQGSLQNLENGHITRGGEIEKRLAWVARYALPAGKTFGLDGANGALYTFGSDVSPAVPPGVTYQRLPHPSSIAMNGLISSEFYDGKIWAVASYANGDVLHFYNGTQVTDWTAGSGATVAGQKAKVLLTHRDKIYATFSSILAWCSVASPTAWQAGAGYGFKNMSNQSAGSEELTGLGRYQNIVAVFARRNIQTWYLDPDPLQNTQRQVLENIGTFAPRSVVTFGSSDLFFLADSGYRSLRARDQLNIAGVSDVGTPIDDLVIAHLATLTEAQRVAAVGVIEPTSGRCIQAAGSKAFVFSYFQNSQISAWSTYDMGFEVSDFVALDGKLWVRGGDTVYQLGGADGKTYDSTILHVDLPYIDGRQIATFKEFAGIDIVAEGEWKVYVSTDPNNPSAESAVAITDNTTLNLDAIGMVGHSPLIKLRFESVGSGPAKLSKVVIHYSQAEAS